MALLYRETLHKERFFVAKTCNVSAEQIQFCLRRTFQK